MFDGNRALIKPLQPGTLQMLQLRHPLRLQKYVSLMQLVFSHLQIAQAATRRRTVFVQANIPQAGNIALAGVSVLKPLRPGDYGIVFTTSGLMIGRGEFICLYTLFYC